MRKIFLPLLICALTANTAEAKIRWTTGKDTECFRSIDGSKQSTVQYYFCGHQTKSCGGLRWIVTHKTPQWMVEGDGKYVEKDGAKWWCCDGTGDENDGDTGIFKSGDQWSTTEDVTIEVEGGTCTYQKTTNVCGKVESDNKCTVPDTCPRGKVLRNRKCVDTCLNSQGYESATSNKCVNCSGDDRGVDSTGVCVVCKNGQNWNGTKCEGTVVATNDGCKSTEYKSPLSEKCVSKSKNVQYSSDMMHECYGCSSDVRFKNCLNIYRAAPDANKLTSTQEGTLKACNVTKAQYAGADAQTMKSELVGKLPVFAKLDLPNSIINKKLTETAAIKISDDELKKALEQQMQVADVVAVADQVMADDISTTTKTTGTTATTGTSVATGTTSIEDALKDIALPTAAGTFVAPTKKLDFSVSKMQAM